ncbi:MAG: ribonuclease P protein component [Spirochaetales bacterium]|jgi:ribonuclease P protein component|nr:ribonuclease P protein component [Spirochaetales bacterium]
MKKSLSKGEILRLKKDIDRVFRSGKKAFSPSLRLRYVKNQESYNRIFVTLARKFGSAPRRNRARRIFKEIYRLQKARLLPGWDLAVIIQPLPESFDFSSQSREWERLLRRAGLTKIRED